MQMSTEDYFEFRCRKTYLHKNPKVYLTNEFVWANEGYAAKVITNDSTTQYIYKTRNKQNCDPLCLEDFNITYSLGKKNRWQIRTKLRDTEKLQDDFGNYRISCYVIERDSLFGHIWRVAGKNLLELEFSPNSNSNIVEFVSIVDGDIEYKCGKQDASASLRKMSHKISQSIRTTEPNKNEIHIHYLIVNFTNSKNYQNSTMWRRTDYTFRNYKRKNKMFRIRHFMDSIREYYSESDSWSNRSEFIVSDIDENYTEHRKISNSLCLGDFILSPMKKMRSRPQPIGD